jgi:hypothetical protein
VSVFGGYGSGGGESLPRVLQPSVRAIATGRFDCSLHEVGTGLSWDYPVRLSGRSEATLLEYARTLHAWGIGRESSQARCLQPVFPGRR